MLCIVNNTNITNIRGLGRKFGTGRDLGHGCGTLYCPIMMTLLDNLYLGCEERIQDVSKKTLANDTPSNVAIFTKLQYGKG